MWPAIFGLTGVIVGSLIAMLKEWLFRKWDDERKGHYLAIRVCTMLDLFLYDCAKVVQDDGTIRGEAKPDGTLNAQVTLPYLSFETLDVDWHAIPSGLAYSVLSLPYRVQRAQRYIDGVADISDPPTYDEVFEARQDEFAKLAMAAADIAARLRTFAKLPDRDRRDWGLMDLIENHLADIERRENLPPFPWMQPPPAGL